MSAEHKKDLVNNFGIPAGKIIILRNWVSPEFKVTQKAEKRDIDVLFVGRLELQKNLFLFIDVIAKLAEIFPSLCVHVVGPGSQSQALKEYAIKNGLKDIISFNGYQDDPSGYYQRAKTFLLTSMFEGQPLALLEAMKMGVPAVTFYYEGVETVIKHNLNGFIAGNIPEAVSEISSLLSSKKKWQRISNNCRKVVMKEYSAKQLDRFMSEIGCYGWKILA